MIVLDTNVVSELIRLKPDERVVEWVAEQDWSNLYLSTISEAELRYGVEILAAGRRRDGLLETIENVFRDDFGGRILSFDRALAQAYAVIAASRRAIGRPINHADCQIAAIARSAGASVATRDLSGFEGCGVAIINPWSGGRRRRGMGR